MGLMLDGAPVGKAASEAPPLQQMLEQVREVGKKRIDEVRELGPADPTDAAEGISADRATAGLRATGAERHNTPAAAVPAQERFSPWQTRMKPKREPLVPSRPKKQLPG